MRYSLIAAAAAALLATTACSHQPGAWGGAGPGYGAGAGPGMGPGMMCGGAGPGYGMGPGMMHGGPGPGYGMGPEMMDGEPAGRYAGLGLSDEQRTAIAGIRREFQGKQSALMDAMHAHGPHRHGAYRDGAFDEEGARKAYGEMAELRRQMFENALAARRRIDAVLTPGQREQLHRR